MEELVRRAMEKDAEAFLELMDTVNGQMYKTAWSVLKNDADVADAVQDTIVTCYEKLGTLRKPIYFKTWMTRILLNECFQILERNKKYVDAEQMPEVPAWNDGMADTRFWELLSLADEKYHLILTLYYSDEFTVPEIARMLSMNENTVKTRLARARDQIRRGMNEETKFSFGC